MTPFRPHLTPPNPKRDTERLGDAWDELVAGHRPIVAGADAELLALAGQLHAEAAEIRPTPTFRALLRETLMHPSPTAAMPSPTVHPLPRLGRLVEIGSHGKEPVTAIPTQHQRVGMRWAAIAATIALLLATAGGGYLASHGPGDYQPRRVTGFQFATPAASPAAGELEYQDPCARYEPYFPCGANIDFGRALIAGGLYEDSVTDVSQVTMLNITVRPEGRITGPLPSDLLTDTGGGIGVDIVLEGAYRTTFTGPVTVSRPGPLFLSHYYPKIGEMVELSRGDTVSYELGTQLTLQNPLSVEMLRFKRLLIHGESTSIDLVGDPGDNNVHARVDGIGQLPSTVAEFPNKEVNILLTYSQIQQFAPFPPKIDRASVVLGPVDAVQPGGEGGEGYILWAVEGVG